jgi:CRP-like cAMP-binding protein
MSKHLAAQQVIERSLPFEPQLPGVSSDSIFAWVRRISNYLEIPQGAVVHSPDEVNDAVYLIHRGLIEFSHIRSDGTPHRWSVLRSGEFFGELRLHSLPGQPYLARALDESVLWKLDQMHLASLFQHRPETLQEILSIMGYKQDLLFCFRSQ